MNAYAVAFVVQLAYAGAGVDRVPHRLTFVVWKKRICCDTRRLEG